jgi:Fic family protein
MNDTFTPELLTLWQKKLPRAFAKRYAARFNSPITWMLDFNFYNTASAVSSSQIEGNTIDLNAYSNKKSIHRSKRNEVKEIENLVAAYEFAQRHTFTEANILAAHALLSETLLPKQERGTYRNVNMIVGNAEVVVYEAVEKHRVRREMKRFFETIMEFKPLSKKKMGHEAFFYAALVHLFLVEVHPFADGNGRLSRLCEKWFLSTWLGKNAWAIPSEAYYFKHRETYYRNLQHIGFSYDALNYSHALPFLQMLPNAA